MTDITIWHYLVLGVLLCVFLGLVIWAFFTLLYVLPMVRGAVYVPSKPEAILAMINLANRHLKKKPLIADLGSGDGRVVEAFGEAGFTAHGFEINPLLVLKAWRRLRRAGLQEVTHIYKESYWDIDLGQYDVIIIYGITYIMEGISKKLSDELRPGSLVISNYFELPGWKLLETQNGVHLYQR